MSNSSDEKHNPIAEAGITTAAPKQDTLPTQRGISHHHNVDAENDVPRPVGWMYKSFRLGPVRLPWYASPPTQLFIVALVCFLCPGMFNATNGLGGGGQLDATVADNANVAVYSTFSIIGFFAGSIVNRLGIRLTLSFGGLGYFLYIASYLSYNHNANAGFVTFAGAFLGLCAGLLWSAQGAIMLSYPPEQSKGRYISWFWMIFNLGGVIGSLVPLGQNINSTAGAVNDGTYIGFMILTFIGAVLAWFLVDARHVRRADGSKVILMKQYVIAFPRLRIYFFLIKWLVLHGGRKCLASGRCFQVKVTLFSFSHSSLPVIGSTAINSMTSTVLCSISELGP